MASKVMPRNILPTGNKSVAWGVAGFTLLEMMIVMVIMSIALLMFIPMLSDRREAYQLQKESERLNEMLHMAALEATVHGQEWGMIVMPKTYRFVYFNNDAQQWALPADSLMASEYALPVFLDMSVQTGGISSLPLDFLTPPELRPNILFLSTGQTSEFYLKLTTKDGDKVAMAISGDGHSAMTLNRNAK